MTKVQTTEILEPDTPKTRNIAQLIKSGIELHGWDKFEELIVEAAELVFVKEEDGRRFYEHKSGELKMSIGKFSS